MCKNTPFSIIAIYLWLQACQLPAGNQSENKAFEDRTDTTVTALQALSEMADTTARANPPTFVLDEFGMITEDDPHIYFVASVDETKYRNHKYIYANGPDSLAFIHIDGKRHFMKTIEWFDVIDDADENMFQLTTIDQSDDYDVTVFQKLEKREEASSTWSGHITVSRRSDGAVFRSALYGSSSH